MVRGIKGAGIEKWCWIERGKVSLGLSEKKTNRPAACVHGPDWAENLVGPFRRSDSAKPCGASSLWRRQLWRFAMFGSSRSSSNARGGAHPPASEIYSTGVPRVSRHCSIELQKCSRRKQDPPQGVSRFPLLMLRMRSVRAMHDLWQEYRNEHPHGYPPRIHSDQHMRYEPTRMAGRTLPAVPTK